MPRKLTEQLRWKIIEKWLDGASKRLTAEHLIVSKRSVSKIRQLYRHYGHVAPPWNLRGRPRILTKDDQTYLRYLLDKHPDWYLGEFQTALAEFPGYHVSKSTILRTFRRMGITHKQVLNYFPSSLVRDGGGARRRYHPEN